MHLSLNYIILTYTIKLLNKLCSRFFTHFKLLLGTFTFISTLTTSLLPVYQNTKDLYTLNNGHGLETCYKVYWLNISQYNYKSPLYTNRVTI